LARLCDNIPSSAIKELEMWQADTFDQKEIDKELGWAEGVGLNTMRVFLHDLLWARDFARFRGADRSIPPDRGKTQDSVQASAT
jgi:hypothetical protein